MGDSISSDPERTGLRRGCGVRVCVCGVADQVI